MSAAAPGVKSSNGRCGRRLLYYHRRKYGLELRITVIDAYDGTSDCNDMHNVEQLMSFQPVAGPAVPLTPFQSGATEINETVMVPDVAGGTMTVRIGLRQL